MQHICNRLLGPIDIRACEIDLIDHRNNGQVVRHRQIHIGNRLRLHPLRRVNQQESPLASRKTPRDLVGKVDMPRRIDQMQRIRLPVPGLVPDGHCMGLDRNATLPLEVHGIEDLIFGLSGSDCASSFQEPVSEG